MTDREHDGRRGRICGSGLGVRPRERSSSPLAVGWRTLGRMDDYRAAMERDRHVMVLLTPVRAGPGRSG